ncbi:MAG TPA: hypothetical protein VKU00_29620, partial [Chthonomonadaceae bacterium]|nr:hypothetical protein [Chthonomonadaceae bacterium]
MAKSELTARPEQERDRRKIAERHWIIACTDVAGHQLASIDWNADTGHLFRVMQNRNYLPRYRGSALSERRVIQ